MFSSKIQLNMRHTLIFLRTAFSGINTLPLEYTHTSYTSQFQKCTNVGTAYLRINEKEHRFGTFTIETVPKI